MSKQDEARRVRDAALVYVGQFGQPSTVKVGKGVKVTVMEATFANVRILLTPPPATDMLAKLTDPGVVAQAAAAGSPIVNFRYLLDIWMAGKKVANLSWDTLEGPLEYATFRAGPWRAAFVNAVARHVMVQAEVARIVEAIEQRVRTQPAPTRH